jgi:hypothetical protein
MNFAKADVPSQRDALKALAEQTLKSVEDPVVRRTALQIVQGCPSRDDLCELQAIFDAVKYGDPRVDVLRGGFKYVADPRSRDTFVSPRRNLDWCQNFGACGGDCDDHAALVAALAGAVGFKTGLRAWGPPGKAFAHVYAVAMIPKREPATMYGSARIGRVGLSAFRAAEARKPKKGWKSYGLDTTVKQSFVGWEPPPGNVMTAWLP